MPDLKNLLRHMKGKAVSVNGHVYAIDMAGIARDIEAEDAEKLLAGQNWETIPMPDSSPLLDDEGEPVVDDGEIGETKWMEPDESMEMDDLKRMADHFEVAYGGNIGKALLIERIKEAMAKIQDENEDD